MLAELILENTLAGVIEDESRGGHGFCCALVVEREGAFRRTRLRYVLK